MHVSTFIRSSSGRLRKQVQELSMFQCIVGSQMQTNSCYRKVKHISLYILNFLCDGLIIKRFKNCQIWWYIKTNCVYKTVQRRCTHNYVK